jgi:hypothetical protein
VQPEGMRPLPQTREVHGVSKKISPARREGLLTIVRLTVGACTLGCGGGGAGSVAPPPPPPPSITVSITPASGTVSLGETLNFSAAVTNASDAALTWSVDGVQGGSAQAGTITTNGVYAAPADLPVGGTVQVTATSHADSSASATVTIASDISVSILPNAASVELGAKQNFQATIQSQGKPDTSIRWSLSGTTCPSACGTVDANGSYLPGSSTVDLTATSVADPSKQSTANLTITSHFTLQLPRRATLRRASCFRLPRLRGRTPVRDLRFNGLTLHLRTMTARGCAYSIATRMTQPMWARSRARSRRQIRYRCRQHRLV